MYNVQLGDDEGIEKLCLSGHCRLGFQDEAPEKIRLPIGGAYSPIITAIIVIFLGMTSVRSLLGFL